MSIAEPGLLEGLNPEQLKAVTHGEGPLLIVAGAGTGKTTVIAKRIAWLIETGRARPEEILALTFTEKAAAELEERVDRLLPIGYVELWIMTFHGFGERVLRERGLDIGLATDFGLLDETAGWLAVRERLQAMGLDYYRPMGDPSKFIHHLLKHFSRAKDELATPKDYREYAEKVELPEDEKKRVLEIAGAFEAYEKILQERSGLDFGALITETIRLFRERPAALEEYRRRFKYVLVDEFQDTNFAQYELVKLLVGDKGNLTVVGDDDQSIYKFRGASVSNILGFKSDFPGAAQVFLTTNYRSKQEILDLSYGFIVRNNPNRLEVRLSGAEAISKKLKAERGGGGFIRHLACPDVEDEARAVAEEIIKLKTADPECAWSDFALLFRANAHAKPFLESLARHGVPHLYVASKGLYLKPVIQDAICYLKLLDNYHESPALYRVLNWEVFGLPAADAAALTREARKRSESLYDALRRAEEAGLGPDSLAEVRRIMALIEKHAERARRTTPARLLKEIFLDTGYYAKLLDEETPENLEAIRCLNQFVRLIQKYEDDDPRPTLEKFMQNLDWELESGEEGSVPFDVSEGPDTVKVMTVHTAKGLEFRYVFIGQLVEDRFPSRNQAEPIPFPDALVKETPNVGADVRLEEERRLFYVACTRAKDGLYLTSAEDVGGARKKKPSRFLGELYEKTDTAGLIDKAVRKPSLDLIEPEREAAESQPSGYSLELPSSYSFSQLVAFDSCPLQYKYAHLLKIPSLDKGSLNFGKIVHAVLETFIARFKENPDKPPKLEELLEEYEKLWTGEWYEDASQRDYYHEAGRKCLANVHGRTLRERPTPWMLEEPFTLKIGRHVLRGKIDRVDKLSDGRAVIYDYKTGKAKDPEARQKEQLFIYQLALSDVWSTPMAEMGFYYVQDDDLRQVKVDEKNLDKIREKLGKRIDEIEASDFAPTPDQHVCRYCDFKDICRFKVI